MSNSRRRVKTSDVIYGVKRCVTSHAASSPGSMTSQSESSTVLGIHYLYGTGGFAEFLAGAGAGVGLGFHGRTPRTERGVSVG